MKLATDSVQSRIAKLSAWTRRRFLVWRGGLMASILLLMIGSADASVIYRYTGNPFEEFCIGTSCNNEPLPDGIYTTADRVTATLELSETLSPNATTDLGIQTPGFALTMNDGHQTIRFVAGDTVRVETDSTGAIVAWTVFLFHLDEVAIMFTAKAPTNAQPSALDFAIQNYESAAFPNNVKRTAEVDGKPGTWTMEVLIDPALSYGSATRTLYQGPLSEAKDIITGGSGDAKNTGLSFAPLSGTQAARGQANANGPAAGAWSNSVNGTGAARGIAFRTYINNTNIAQTFKVNAAFDGKFLAAPYNMPIGPLKAGAAIHVFDTRAFATKLAAAPAGGTAQFLLGSYAPAAAADPLNAFSNLRSLFPEGILGTAQTVVNATPPPVSTSVSTSVSTGFVTVAPQQKFTVMYDVATYSAAQTVADRSGSGVVNFLNTLAPAAVHFTGLAGEAIAGLAISDGAPPPAPAATAIGLTPASSMHPAGGTASATAAVTAANDTALPVVNTPVEFYITAGPNLGKTGVAITDAQGRATFSYVGDNDVGKDMVQARIASLQSNTVEHDWTPARCPQNQNFWLRYPGLWPVSTLSIGGLDYDQQTLIKLLKLAPRNPSLALLQQVAITKLNTAYGSDTSRLALAVLTADSLLTQFNRDEPYQNQVDLTTSVEMVTLAARMAIYNSGLTAKSCRS